MFVDEAAYMPYDVLQKELAPLLGVRTTSIILISTPGEQPTNLFNELCKSPHFKVVLITYVCGPCLEKGVTEVCKHRAHERSHWLGGNEDIVKELMGTNNLSYQRDMLGIHEVQGTPYCFPKHLLDATLAAPPVDVHQPPRFVYTAIDPNVGTDDISASTSDFAIVSISGPGTIIVGMDAIPAQSPPDFEPVLRAHLQNIRNLPHFENCYFVLDVEANGQMIWYHINSIIKEFSNVIFTSDYKNKTATNTSNKSKRDMVILTRTILESRDLHFHPNYVTTSGTRQEMRRKLIDQMALYKRVNLPSSTTSSNTLIYSGKGDNHKQKDDLCLTLQRDIYRRRVFLESPKYACYRF